MPKLALRLALVSAALAVTASSARAQTATATIAVTATVVPSCTIAGAPVAFGNYDPVVTNAAAALNASGTVTVTCTRGTTYSVGLGAGNSTSGSRAMRHATLTDELPYQLYQDAARTTVWTDAAMISGTATSTAAVSYPVYGSIPSGQDVPTGDYADAVIATVNF